MQSSQHRFSPYNSLCDEHLATYNSSPKNLKHLRKMGLITLDNVILDENLVRLNLAHRQQVRQSNILQADTVVSKAIEIERKRRFQIKQRLDFLAKIEKVEKVKGLRHHPIGIQEFDPYDTSPMPSISTRAFHRSLEMCEDQLSTFVGAVKTRVIPKRTSSPYLNNSVLRRSLGISAFVPRPPSAPQPSLSQVHGGASRKSSRIKRPYTAPVPVTCPVVVPKLDQIHSNVKMTLCYIGKTINLSGYRSHQRSHVSVLQQHCGGNTVTIYKGFLSPKDNFEFLSRRHYGNPLGLSIYLDGIIETRVSSCCEYRHNCGKMLGGAIAQFKLVSVEGGKPCYRCKDERERHPRFSRGVSPVGVKVLHDYQGKLKQGKLENKSRKQSTKRKEPSSFEKSRILFAEDAPVIGKLEIMSRSHARVFASADYEDSNNDFSSFENDVSEDTLPQMCEDDQTPQSSPYERPKTARGRLPHQYRTERPMTARAVSRDDKELYGDEQSGSMLSSDKSTPDEYASLEEHDSSLTLKDDMSSEDEFTSEDELTEEEVKTRDKTLSSEEDLASDEDTMETLSSSLTQHKEDDESPEELTSEAEAVEEKPPPPRLQHKEDSESPEEELTSEAEAMEEKPPPPRLQHKEDSESPEEELTSEAEAMEEKPPPPRLQHKEEDESPEEELTSEAEAMKEKPPPPRLQHKEEDESPEERASEADTEKVKYRGNSSSEEKLSSAEESLLEKSQPHHSDNEYANESPDKITLSTDKESQLEMSSPKEPSFTEVSSNKSSVTEDTLADVGWTEDELSSHQ